MLILLALACQSSPTTDDRPSPVGTTPSPTGDTASTPQTSPTGTLGATGTTADTHTTATTGSTGATGATGDTALPPFDCATVPQLPGPEVMLAAPRGYNDVVFDLDGAMVGSDESSLVRATDAVTGSVWVPGVGRGYKMGRLANGDIVMALSASEGGGIVRVTPNGGRTFLGTGLLAYGLAVGSDDNVYVATNYTAGGAVIYRVPTDGSNPVPLVDASMAEPRDIAFSRDYDRLYWGTLNGGSIWAVSLDASLDVVGLPEQVARVPEGWHDTVEVDACGNLYVGSVFESAIYRIFTDGTVQLFLDWSFNDYGHGLTWGDASGGWNPEAMYITHPYVGSRVSEVDVGVPGAHWPGVVLGGATL